MDGSNSQVCDAQTRVVPSRGADRVVVASRDRVFRLELIFSQHRLAVIGVVEWRSQLASASTSSSPCEFIGAIWSAVDPCVPSSTIFGDRFVGSLHDPANASKRPPRTPV